MQKQTYLVDKNYSSVYIYLRQNGFSEKYATALRKVMGYIEVNGQAVTIRKPLQKGDKLTLNASPSKKSDVAFCDIKLDILFEDEYYLIVNKPSLLACTPTRSHYSQNLGGGICNYMKDKQEDFVLRIVGRLDRETAGIVICAKSLIAYKHLGAVQKTYYALAQGKIEEKVTINKNIATIINKMGYNENKRVISPTGKPATTFVEPIKYYEKQNFTLIKCTLLHGRTHQIRLHLSSIGHPLLGDSFYGTKSDLISHTALVCKEISFVHPFSHKNMTLQIDFPDQIKKLLQ